VDGLEEGMLYDGYYIVLPQFDARYITEDTTEEPVKATLYRQNAVHIRYNSWPYGLLHDRDDLEKSIDERCMVGIDAKHNEFLQKPGNRKWKHLFLNFPQGHTFSAKALNADAGEDHELELELVELTGDGVKPADCITGRHCYAAWKVARVDTAPRKKGKMAPQEKKSKAAKLFEEKKAAMKTG
jgi:hypothetical protein